MSISGSTLRRWISLAYPQKHRIFCGIGLLVITSGINTAAPVCLSILFDELKGVSSDGEEQGQGQGEGAVVKTGSSLSSPADSGASLMGRWPLQQYMKEKFLGLDENYTSGK